jgi:hypothetical protein
MFPRVVPSLLMGVLLAGCGKPLETSPPVPTSKVEPAQGAGTAAAPATEEAANASEAALNAALGELTQVLRKYSFERQRLPKTINELVAAGYLKAMPRAPQGRKFEIDPKTVQVVLVKQ